jgi:hypothetical protein
MTARQQAIEAAARAAFATDYGTYSDDACADHNRWTWEGDGHGEAFKDAYRQYATAAVDAIDVPALLNDLADRIEAEAPSGTYAVGDATFALGIDRAAALVRAWAAKGWTE